MGFLGINNAHLMISQITASRFSMKCGFISLKCTLVSMTVQVKQNVTSDVITS